MRSVMQHSFSQVPQANIQRSTFNRDSGYKTTFNAGDLIPFFVDEVLPGDTFNVNATMFARLATPIFPIMDNIFLDVFWFFVPHRIVWTHWVNFMGEEEAPGDYVNSVVTYLTPQVTTPAGGWAEGSLADYFGIPTKINGLGNANAFAFRAYNDIYNEWFRDENLNTKASMPAGTDGPDSAALYVIQKRNKRHDYFTSCLPWPQKGPGVSIPLGTTAPVIGIQASNTTTGAAVSGNWYQTTGALATGFQAPTTNVAIKTQAAGAVGAGNLPQIYADLSTATAATINSLRQAFQVQRLYERDARGGSRYTELVRSHFGVVSPDARLQRPEYLGGGTIRVNISPIAQNSATSAQPTPMGTLAAMGTAAGRNGFTKSFTEHGTIMGIMSARADLTYDRGYHRSWTRRTRFDFYWPVLANLGEQAVLNKEIFAQGTAADDQAFGYQERWAEYRYKPSQVTGLFRANATGSLNAWHLAQTFGALPTLNVTFMQETPPMSRIKAVTSQPDFIFDSFIQVRATRPMPVYSVPGMIDHF